MKGGLSLAVSLLLGSAVILACILANKVSSRFGVPMLLGFILLGMVFGSDGLFRIPFDNFSFAETVCSVALIFIMFYGGFGTRWKEARPVAAKSILLSSVGVVLTWGLTGVFCHYALRIEWLESLLIGAVLSSTDAASVFSVLRSRKLSLKHNTDSLLEVESGSNDPWSYMLTVIVLSLMNGNHSAGGLVYTLFAQIVYGTGAGVLIALGALWVLRHFTFGTNGFDAAFVIAVAILSYALPAAIGGNGYLSAYIVGIILGNRPIKNKKSLVHFFDGITSLMQMLIFFMLGLLAFPSQMPAVLLPALLIALFLTLVARPLAVLAILGPFRAPLAQQGVVAWAGLRGASSIVFAIMATVNPAYMKNDVFHIVFCVVLFSIAIQGTLLPWISKRLHMINADGDILKTFNDYSEEAPVQFIRLVMRPGHVWIGRMVKDTPIPPETLLLFIRRDGKDIIPHGSTPIRENDILVLGAVAYQGDSDIQLSELTVDEQHQWCGKTISQLALPDNTLIMMIRRDGRTILPRGKTLIRAGDVLVMNT